ncbi:hypothetical protein LUZ61_016489 [Rhynchospora tenuis]|uniref:Serine aminopeptidase S33 domain-containing protein n=1 Tax=Rhynchospora tenuis TaxID=198213 RepID=A0AAD5Z5K7_9POAL|nr:hypothetical protein LUZ61_016489 [Rhynchospora tenuis]
MAYEGDATYEEEFITTYRGIRLFTCKWLPKKKEPKALIFICHGFGAECSVSLTDTAIRLVRAGYAVYGIDYEGHGKSSGKRCYISSFDRIVSDCSNHFKSVAEKAENNNKKRFLYGISMGGAVAINMHRNDPSYWNGAILMAPLCKISDEMRPGPILLGALEMLCRIVPTWKLIPSKDMLDKVCKDPKLREQIRSNQYMYMGNIPLKTGHQLLVAASEIEKNLQQITMPFFALHGGDDIVTNVSVSKLLYESASSHDKTLKIYPGMLHVLFGEAPEDVDLIFSDIISWLDQRSSTE